MHLWSFVELVKYSHLFLSYVLSLPPGLLNGLSRSPPACLMDWLRIDGVFYDYHSAHSEPFIGASWMALMHFTSLSFTPLWLSSFSFWISFFCVFLFCFFLLYSVPSSPSLYLTTGLQPVICGFWLCVCVYIWICYSRYRKSWCLALLYKSSSCAP